MSAGATFDLQPPVRDADGWSRTVNQARAGRALCEADPPVRVAVIYDHNPLMTLPRQDLVRQGLEREDLFTVVLEQVMTDTARYADVVLPATTFLEHAELRKGYGASVLTLAHPVIAPVGEARPNDAIFRELAKRAGVWRKGDPETVDDMLVAAVGKRVARTLRKDGIAFPDVRNPIQMVDARPFTADGKIHLAPPELERDAPAGLYGFQPDPATPHHPLALISPARSAQITSSLGELHREEVPLQLHPDDAAARGLADGDLVRAFNELGSLVTTLRVTDEVRPGTACLPKGLWSHHTRDGATANALVPDTLADVGGAACYNDARVEVARA
jgi:anaerobic selenocysteine-containing dehydrogenase